MKAEFDEDCAQDKKSSITFDKTRSFDPKVGIELGGFEDIVTSDVFYEVNEIADEHYLTASYDKVVNIFGQFKQEEIALGLSELR
ncbi:MAG: hypothetical protein ACI9T7_000256 [Oleiphilaceae bacterium]|jgi:hypothetical protein